MQPTETGNQFQLRLRNDVHLLRKFWHMGTGLVGLYAFYASGLGPINFAKILMAIAMAGFAVDLIRTRFEPVNNFVMKVMGSFMRESEKDGMSGFPFYALGASLSLFFFPEKIAVLSIIFLMFSDPISSFFGILYGKDKFLPNKSIQGTLAGFVTCYLLALFYGMTFSDNGGVSLLFFAIFAGAIGAISELLSVFVDDNLTIPLVSAAGMTFINLFLHIY